MVNLRKKTSKIQIKTEKIQKKVNPLRTAIIPKIVKKKSSLFVSLNRWKET